MNIVETFTKYISKTKFTPDSNELFKSLEDGADRWNFSYSVVIIGLMAVVSTTNIYILRSFECTIISGVENMKNIDSYVQSLCWSMGTIAFRDDELVPESNEQWAEVKRRGNISFYQWVPFCLALQAILFYIPHLIWNSMASRTFGGDMNLILETASEGASKYENRKTKFAQCANQLIELPIIFNDYNESRWTNMKRRIAHKMPGGRLLMFSKYLGNWVMLTYLFTKLLYLLNLFGQLYIIRSFLTYGRRDSLAANDFYSFTKNLLYSISTLHEWEGGGSVFFPRKTYCRVKLRVVGNRQNTIFASCALPVNIYTEKMYIFLWIWLLFVLTITLLSLVSWFLQFLFAKSQESYILKMMRYGDPTLHYNISASRLKKFTRDGLKPDGLFLLKMIEKNVGCIAAHDVCIVAWDLYFKQMANSSSTLDVPMDTYIENEKVEMKEVGNGLMETYHKEFV